MNIELISVTRPLNGSSPEELVSFVARVSNPDNQENYDTAPKLIKYLIDHKHWSPFEHVSMTVEIQTSRAIAAQILRHRSFIFQEFSQRYSEATEFEPIQLRKQAKKNRQSSTEEFNPEIKEPVIPSDMGSNEMFSWERCSAKELVDWSNAVALDAYQQLIKAGVAKECARMVLPLATQTTLYMTGSIRSWIHYLEIRDDDHTQLEHQLIAKEIKKIFIQQFPQISKALEWNTEH